VGGAVEIGVVCKEGDMRSRQLKREVKPARDSEQEKCGFLGDPTEKREKQADGEGHGDKVVSRPRYGQTKQKGIQCKWVPAKHNRSKQSHRPKKGKRDQEPHEAALDGSPLSDKAHKDHEHGNSLPHIERRPRVDERIGRQGMHDENAEYRSRFQEINLICPCHTDSVPIIGIMKSATSLDTICEI
jgi:hypothetical protein